MARVAVTLVTGASPHVREQAIFDRLPRDGATAVILEGLADAATPLASHAHLSIARIAAGCLCCAGQLVLRVTLNRVLRQRPDRLYIGMARSDHLDQLRSWLASAPYDQLLELTPDVHGAN